MLNKLEVNQSFFIDVMERCMTNPNNKSFYYKGLTPTRVEEILSNFIEVDEEFVEIFWAAYSRVQAKILNKKPTLHYFVVRGRHIAENCPDCGCTSYVQGCNCPNCDYYTP